MRSLALVPYASVTVKTDVPATVPQLPRSSASAQFPGVDVEQVYLRRYPHGDARPPSCSAPSARSARASSSCTRFRGVRQGTVVGKDGHRARLRPLPARRRRRASASRSTRSGGRRARRRGARPGPGPRAAHVARPRPPADRRGRPRPDDRHGPRHRGRVRRARPAQRRGPRDGLVPDVRPGGPRRADHPEAPTSSCSAPNAGAPLFNRAIGGLYPTGSTFKPITALAAPAASGIITPSTPIDDPGCIEIGAAKQSFCNAGKEVNGTVNLPRRDPGLLGRLLLHARPRPQPARRPAAAEDGRAGSGWARRPASTCRARRPGLVPDRALARRRSASASAAAASAATSR